MQNTVEHGAAERLNRVFPAGAPLDERTCAGKTILLIGGSNAGLRDGWAAQLQAGAGQHVVENRFLGAVGSLYGLMALLKLLRDGGPLPNIVVFEYCLNDVLLVEAGVLGDPLIRDALDAVIDFCADARIGLLFVCLEPRPDARRESRKALARINPLYAAAARRAGIPCLRLDEIFGKAPTVSDYQDENHLTPAASSHVAGAVRAAIDAGVPIPRRIAGESPHFEYLDATQARTLGPCRPQHLATRVFSGPFIEIARGGASFWRGRGRLVGVMLQSTTSSGIYVIRARAAAFRKNPRSHMQEIVRNLILLHYTTRTIAVDGEVEIGMPDDEAQLMNLPEDRTLLAVPPTVPFAAQTLEIHGVMLWRRRSLLHRLRAYFSS